MLQAADVLLSDDGILVYKHWFKGHLLTCSNCT